MIPNIEETNNIREIEEEVVERLMDLAIECKLVPQDIRDTLHHQLQKAREQRKGWKGYVAVDPQADHYKYSPVFSDRKGAELWVKGKEISGLEVVEVDILLVDHSELDQPNK